MPHVRRRVDRAAVLDGAERIGLRYENPHTPIFPNRDRNSGRFQAVPAGFKFAVSALLLEQCEQLGLERGQRFAMLRS